MDHDLPMLADPAAVHRDLTEALERTERLGDAIEACLDEAERELEDIRRMSTQQQSVIPALVAGIQGHSERRSKPMDGSGDKPRDDS
jgi:hypothetical protein